LELAKVKQKPITTEEAQKVANDIELDGYVEISSRTGYNIYVPFEKGINAVFKSFQDVDIYKMQGKEKKCSVM